MATRMKAPLPTRLARPGSGITSGLRPPGALASTSSGPGNHHATPPASLPHPPSNASAASTARKRLSGVPGPPKPDETPAEPAAVEFAVGDRVLVGGVKPGTIAFLGPTQFARGVWAGVVLDTPDGKNSGAVNGVVYFSCEPNYGLFAKPDKLKLVQKAASPSTSNAPAQPAAVAKPTPPPTNLVVGDRVIVEGVKQGQLAFLGPTQFAKGVWAGVVLDNPEGKNDGSVNGVQYFESAPNHGLFTRPMKLVAVKEPSPSQPAFAAAGVGAGGDMQRSRPLRTSESSLPSNALTPEELRLKAEQMQIGDRVMVSGTKEGTLRFIGPTHFAKGVWVGVELDGQQGKNDGAVSGKRYFQCQPLHGLFAPLPKVEWLAPGIKEESAANQTGGIKERRLLSSSSVSSISSLSSLRMRHQQAEGDAPRIVSPPDPGPNLSHIMFEKDHQIAMLQSSNEQAEQEKMKLVEQVTELRRQVEDTQFQMEEQSIISNDQLSSVQLQSSKELAKLREELAKEKERSSILSQQLETAGGGSAVVQTDSTTQARFQDLQQELTTSQEWADSLSSENKRLQDLLNQMSGDSSQQLAAVSQQLSDKDRQVEDLEREIEMLKSLSENCKTELKLTEDDYKSTERAIASLESELENTRQELKDAMDLCAQQEVLLEDRNSELVNMDEQKRQAEREIQQLTACCSELESTQQQLISERDQALAEGLAQSKSVDSQQAQLSQQRMELMTERDQARNQLRVLQAELEKFQAERDELRLSLDDIQHQRKQVQSQSQQMTAKYDSAQTELAEFQEQKDKMRKEISYLREQLDQQKASREQQIELAEAHSMELRRRLDKAGQDRDLALQEAQELSDKLEAEVREKEELSGKLASMQSQLDDLQYQLEEVSSNRQSDEYQTQSQLLAVQQQLESTEEMLEIRERELQEAKEQIHGLEDELVVASSRMEDGRRLEALEDEKMALESKVNQLTKQLNAAKSAAGPGAVSASELQLVQEEKEEIQKALNDKEQEVSFLNSVISELQTKVETLEALSGLGNADPSAGFLDESEDDLVGQLPPPRLFCDICDVFDLHDTNDCPQQETTDSPPHSMYQGHRAHERPYCDNCEMFGHWTDDCEYEDTY